MTAVVTPNSPKAKKPGPDTEVLSGKQQRCEQCKSPYFKIDPQRRIVYCDNCMTANENVYIEPI